MTLSRSDSWTAWNDMQGGLSCGKEPASPVLSALIKPLEKVACDFFQ